MVRLKTTERMVLMDNQVKLYCEGVEMILQRDYAEIVMSKIDLEILYRAGYTEEAAAQKIFEENSKMIKPAQEVSRPNGEGKGQGVNEVTGMKFFQAAVRTERHYSRLPTEIAKMLFQKILQILNKK